MKRLIFLRHGQSEYNLFHRFTGWDDCALTPEGKEQARQAGVLLRQAGILPQRAYVSKLVRARQTLQSALQTAGLQISATPAWQLNERHYGAVQGLTARRRAADSARNKYYCGGALLPLAPCLGPITAPHKP